MNRSSTFYEKLTIGMLLAAAAGGLDAYSYLEHGEVFAGLQTGNLILLGIHLGQFKWEQTVQYVVSILFFAIGTIIVRWFQKHERLLKRNAFSIDECVLMYEISLIVLVALFSKILPNTLVTGMLSLTASAQLQHFRKLNGGPFTSLMMTGNIRTAAESMYDALIEKNQTAWRKGLDTLSIIGSFVGGALISGALTGILGSFTIIFSGTALFAIILIRYTDIKNKSLR